MSCERTEGLLAVRLAASVIVVNVQSAASWVEVMALGSLTAVHLLVLGVCFGQGSKSMLKLAELTTVAFRLTSS